MFEYCKARHVDPSYEFFGTIDYGILDLELKILLMYSEVYSDGRFSELSIFQPFKFDDFIAFNKIKGKNLRALFKNANKVKGVNTEIKCIKVEKEALMPIIMQDVASLPPEIQALVETAVAETF